MTCLRISVIMLFVCIRNIASSTNEEGDLHFMMKVMKEMKKEVNEMKDLESRVAKLEDLSRVGTLRTCAEYAEYGISTSGLYVVDPDGHINGEAPFEAYCNFKDGSTQVLHNAEILTDVAQCHDPGCFNKSVGYTDGINGGLVPLSQLEALITLSETCSQEFVYQCTLAPLRAEGIDYAFWEDRTGERNFYFTGSNKGYHSCMCHFTDEGCVEEETKGNTCSCDANLPVGLEDTGIITNKTALPVMSISFGGLLYPIQTAKFRLGRLICSGKAGAKEENSCSALKKVGVMKTGYYNIKKDDATHISLVHCNMTGGGYDDVPQTDEISSSSPLGTIAAWVPKVDTDSHEESLPDGWLPCDGTTITKGPWAGAKTPDLNSVGRFLRGGTAEEVLTLEDHQVQDHEHDDGGHSHTTSPHTHGNDPHTHGNTPHSHTLDLNFETEGPSHGDWSHATHNSQSSTNTQSVNIHTSTITIDSSTINVHSSSSGMGGVSSSSNRGDETRPVNARVVWIMRVY